MERDKVLSLLKGTYVPLSNVKPIAAIKTIYADDDTRGCSQSLARLFSNHSGAKSVKITLQPHQLPPMF